MNSVNPADCAALGVRVMRTGKDFMADKRGFLSLDSSAEARRVQAEIKRIYSPGTFSSRRLLRSAMVKCLRLLNVSMVPSLPWTMSRIPSDWQQ